MYVEMLASSEEVRQNHPEHALKLVNRHSIQIYTFNQVTNDIMIKAQAFLIGQ